MASYESPSKLSERDVKKRRLNAFGSKNSPLKQALSMLSPRRESQPKPHDPSNLHSQRTGTPSLSARKRSDRPVPTKENASNEPTIHELYFKEHGDFLNTPPGTPDHGGTWRKTRNSIMMSTGTFSKSITTASSQVSLRLKSVKRQIPDVRSMWAASPSKSEYPLSLFNSFDNEPVPSLLFGKELIDIMKSQIQQHPELEIPLIVRDSIDFVLSHGLLTQGIFRLSASSAELDRVSKIFDADPTVEFTREVNDIHVACCLLKKFIRELPTSVIPLSLEADIQAIDLSAPLDDPQTLIQAKEIICSQKLHPCHYHVLERIVKLCSQVALHAEQNKMDASNLAVVFGPNIQPSSMPEPGDTSALLAMISKGGNPQAHINHFLHVLIHNSTFFFP